VGPQAQICQRAPSCSVTPLRVATDATRRLGLNVVLYGDRLFQQYAVDSCAKMKQQRLNYLRFNQNSLELTLSGE